MITFDCQICLTKNLSHDEIVHGQSVVICRECYSTGLSNIAKMFNNYVRERGAETHLVEQSTIGNTAHDRDSRRK